MAMGTCLAMGVLNAKLIMPSNDKNKVRGLLPWQQGLHSKESHNAILVSQ